MKDSIQDSIHPAFNVLTINAGSSSVKFGAFDTSDNTQLFRSEIKRAGVNTAFVNVVVYAGAVHLWGGVRSAEQHASARIAAQTVAGAPAVEDHLGVISPRVLATLWAE